MNNQEIANVFNKIANLLEIKGEVVYKTLAYRKAAENILNQSEDIQKIYEEDRLTDIPGIGKAIAEKIKELLETGNLEFLDKLEQEVPPSLIEILEVPDVGPKKAALFWKEAGITNLTELEMAAQEGRLRKLPGMGEKSEKRILDGIAMLSRRSTRMLLGTAWEIGHRWLSWLRSIPQVEQAEIAGSLNRWKTTIGDLDIVAASNYPSEVMKAFVEHPEVAAILSHGENKSSVELKNKVHIQVWIQPPERFGCLWQYATGSKDHNVHLRELAQRQGFSLSEKGITSNHGEEFVFSDEKHVYEKLGLPWIPPELRENRGEIDAAFKNQLPDLIVMDDIKSDLHMHSNWSDGKGTILEMAETARQNGLQLIGICDHSVGLGIANGLDVKRLRQQREEIDQVQAQLRDSIIILQGTEVEILADGSIDFEDDVLEGLDIVVASLHSSLRQPREAITERLIKAIKNPNIDIIGHPSGRLLPNREGADLDWDQVLEAAKEHHVALEINSDPSRLDLDEIHARRASEMGVLLSIDSDAHHPDALKLTRFGVSVARRVWVKPSFIINTWGSDQLLHWLQNRK